MARFVLNARSGKNLLVKTKEPHVLKFNPPGCESRPEEGDPLTINILDMPARKLQFDQPPDRLPTYAQPQA